MMRLAAPLILASLFLVASVRTTAAGGNGAGVAHLSWQATGDVVNLSSAPSDTFPLYLSVSGVSDVQALAVLIQWFPLDLNGACYGIVPSPAAGTCEGTSSVTPLDNFQGESTTNWWSIARGASATDYCARWLVNPSGCPVPRPAIFRAIVRVQDSNGLIDTLRTNRATIGAAYGGSLRALSVSPNVLVPSTSTLIRVHGTGFLPGARVTLNNNHGALEASEVIALTPGELAATVAPSTSDDTYEVTVSSDSTSTVSEESITTAQAAPAPALPRPSNAAAGIHTLDFVADRVLSVNVSPSIFAPPANFTTDSLLVTRPALSDTMAIFKSRSFGIEFNGGVAEFPSYVDYKIAPPQYATSIGLLQMGVNVFSAPPAFNDSDDPIVRIRALYTNGDSSVLELKVGRQIRDFRDGTVTCPLGPILQRWTQFPDDPLTAPVYANAGFALDAQELRLPGSKRVAQLQAIRISEVPNLYGAGCASSGFSGSQSDFHGISVWPSFEISNRHNQSVQLQKQVDDGANGFASRSKPYGGYILGDTLFGAHGTFQASGCMLSCMAMANTYFGNPVSVLELNKYLALNDGYDPTALVTIGHVNGQSSGATVSWTLKDDVKLSLGDTVLVESKGTTRRRPLVTLVVGPTISQGTILRWHRSGSLDSGMTAVGYGLVRAVPVAARKYSRVAGHAWDLIPLVGTASTLPPLVEQALADSLPVVLEEPHHYVLGRGWRPSFGSNFANGTYMISDPGHTGVTRLNQNFTLQSGAPASFGNTFVGAKACVPVDSTHFSPAAVGEGTVTFVLQGGGRLSIVDPSGRGLDFHDRPIGYDGNIPGANAWTEYGAGLDGDPASEDAVEYVELSDAVGGDYRVLVVANTVGTFGLGASTVDGDGNAARAYAEYQLQTGQAVTFNAHVVQGASSVVRLDTLGFAGVDQHDVPLTTGLVVRPNPSSGKVEFIAELARAGQLNLELYDVAGRLVAKLWDGPIFAGRKVIRWDAASRNGVRTRAGLYFARMRVGNQVFTRRVLVTQ